MLNGAHRTVEFGRDFFIAQPTANELIDLKFMPSQPQAVVPGRSVRPAFDTPNPLLAGLGTGQFQRGMRTLLGKQLGGLREPLVAAAARRRSAFAGTTKLWLSAVN